nr:hypothetical protein [Sphingomonas sp.]
MGAFLGAHGYDPGPAQRPQLAGAIAGLLATIPAIGLLHLLGSLAVEARILGTSIAATIAAGWTIMAVAGAVYSRLLGRAANDRRGGWLFGMAFGFVVWAAGAVLVLPIVGGGEAPAGDAALGVFLSLVLWGGTLGALLPIVHRPLHKTIESEAGRPASGPSANLGRARR